MPFQGQEYLINSTTADNQDHSIQTVLGNGDILVTWESGEKPNVPTEVDARILNPDGTVNAPDFVVDTTPGLSSAVTATTLTNGDALLSWSSGADTLARVIDAQGHMEPEFSINSGSEIGTSAATLPDGNVMLLSTAITNTFGGREIAGHLLGANGAPTGSFTIPFPGNQVIPAVTAMSDGDAFVTWEDGNSHVTYGQILNPDGSAHAPYFQLDPNSVGASELEPTALSNGNVLVTWGQNDGIHGQIVGAGGTPAGSDFLISAPGSESAEESVTALADGRAIAIWEQFDGSNGGGIEARVINADGSMGQEFVVNSATDRTETDPHVTELPNGEIFVSWTSSDPNSGEDIHGRLLTLDHTISGTPGDDVLHGSAGADDIYGAAGNDSLTGGAGDDILSGGSGHNLLWGNEGNDTFLGGSGTDTFAGGTGSDTVVYQQSSAGVTVNLATGTASGGDAAGDHLESIENVTGSTHNDALTGDAGANHLDGGAGNDLIWGGDGNDTLVGGHGADTLSGGQGIDTADYSASLSGVTVNLATGTGSGGDAAGDHLESIENIIGSAHNDTVTGDATANHLDGGAGNDLIWGSDGNDTLVGGSGADTLSGGKGIDTVEYSTSQSAVTVNLSLGTGSGGDAQGDKLTSIENIMGSAHDDTLIGNAAGNHLDGGAGMDVLTGGAGADTFVFKTIQDSLPGHEDQVTDFSSAQGDHIDLSAIDANTQVAGHQAFDYIGTGAFSDVAGQLRYDGHVLQGDINGDGTADFSVHVNVASLTHGDLIL
jgi:Ca2+-binding RTX toxin-like protein